MNKLTAISTLLAVSICSCSKEDIEIISPERNGHSIAVTLTHSERTFSQFSPKGDNAEGEMDWGDGTKGTGTEFSHSYTDETEQHTASIRIWNAKGFTISRLGTITELKISD